MTILVDTELDARFDEATLVDAVIAERHHAAPAPIDPALELSARQRRAAQERARKVLWDPRVCIPGVLLRPQCAASIALLTGLHIDEVIAALPRLPDVVQVGPDLWDRKRAA